MYSREELTKLLVTVKRKKQQKLLLLPLAYLPLGITKYFFTHWTLLGSNLRPSAGGSDSVLVQQANIRLGWKRWSATNTLAYFWFQDPLSCHQCFHSVKAIRNYEYFIIMTGIRHWVNIAYWWLFYRYNRSFMCLWHVNKKLINYFN
jgi:hypothetical protein